MSLGFWSVLNFGKFRILATLGFWGEFRIFGQFRILGSVEDFGVSLWDFGGQFGILASLRVWPVLGFRNNVQTYHTQAIQ